MKEKSDYFSQKSQESGTFQAEEAVREAVSEPSFRIPDQVDFGEVMEYLREVEDIPDTWEIEDITPEMLRDGIVGLDCEVIESAIASYISEHHPDIDPEEHPVVVEAQKLLEDLAYAAYDVSEVVVKKGGDARGYTVDDTIRLAEASEALANLIHLTGYDTRTAAIVKRKFVRMLAHGTTVHKMTSSLLHGSEALGERQYLRSERELLRAIDYQMRKQLGGAVDMELATSLALRETNGIRDVAFPSAEDDVRNGIDIEFQFDPNELAQINRKITGAVSEKFRRAFKKDVWHAVQVKSHHVDEAIPEGMRIEVSKHDRSGQPKVFLNHDRRSGGKRATIFVDVYSNHDVKHEVKVSFNGMDLMFRQLDFGKARRIAKSGIEGILDAIIDKFLENHQSSENTSKSNNPRRSRSFNGRY